MLPLKKQPHIGYHLSFAKNQNTLQQQPPRTSFFHRDPQIYLQLEDHFNDAPSEQFYKQAVLTNVSQNAFIPHTPYTLNLGSFEPKYMQWNKARLLFEAHQTRVCGLKYLNIHCGTSKYWSSKTECIT